MNFVFLLSDGPVEYNSARYRTTNIARALRHLGHKVNIIQIDNWIKNTDLMRRLAARADVIVIQRVLLEQSVAQAKYWASRGVCVIADWDDAYQIISDTNTAARFWKDGIVDINYRPLDFKISKKLSVHPIDQFRQGLAFCSAGTMPSKILAEDWREYVRTYYLPNYFDFDSYLSAKEKIKPRGDAKIFIGWGGSMSHIPSFRDSGVEQALTRIFKQRSNLHFILAGDPRVHERLPLPANRKVYQPYVRWYDWPKVMGRFDIMLAPMVGRYDASRSHIKPVESIVMGLPYIASKTLAYKEYWDTGVHVENTPEDWESALLNVIDNIEDHRQQIAGYLDRALRWDVIACAREIEAKYEQIMEETKG